MVLMPAGIRGSTAGSTDMRTAAGADMGASWPAGKELGAAAESPGQQGSSRDASLCCSMASWHAIFSDCAPAIRHVAAGTNATARANTHPSQPRARPLGIISRIIPVILGRVKPIALQSPSARTRPGLGKATNGPHVPRLKRDERPFENPKGKPVSARFVVICYPEKWARRARLTAVSRRLAYYGDALSADSLRIDNAELPHLAPRTRSDCAPACPHLAQNRPDEGSRGR
jgi:hypothetical protein